jgi:alkyldihydroxyacetonephosphate synthase
VIGPRLDRRATISLSPQDLNRYGCDCWPVAIKEKQSGGNGYVPEVVVTVVTRDDVTAVLSWADDASVPVTPWGLGSSVVGGPLAVAQGITVDLSKMNKILEIDEENLVVRVEAGVRGSDLEAALNARSLTLNHSPQSLDRSTVGGWIATRATGQFSSRYGGIEELCVSVEAVLPDGTVVETRDVPRMAVGPDLKQIFIGSEGCFGIVTKATLRVFPLAEARLLQTIDFASIGSGLRAMRAMMAAGARPFLVRLYDIAEARHVMGDEAYPAPTMFLGCEGPASVAEVELAACLGFCEAEGGTPRGADGAAHWMDRRFDFSAVERTLDRPGGIAETIEVSHTWSGIVATYETTRLRLQPLVSEVLGHFSHAYTDGVSLYFIILGEAEDATAAGAVLGRIWEITMETALETGAAISHHHGIGLARTGYVRRTLGSSMDVLDRIKAALDPNGVMNPGKLGLGSRVTSVSGRAHPAWGRGRTGV